jgi:hypothetical protein
MVVAQNATNLVVRDMKRMWVLWTMYYCMNSGNNMKRLETLALHPNEPNFLDPPPTIPNIQSKDIASS